MSAFVLLGTLSNHVRSLVSMLERTHGGESWRSSETAWRKTERASCPNKPTEPSLLALLIKVQGMQASSSPVKPPDDCSPQPLSQEPPPNQAQSTQRLMKDNGSYCSKAIRLRGQYINTVIENKLLLPEINQPMPLFLSNSAQHPLEHCQQ